MREVLIFSAVVALLGVVVWIVLLLWAAREDGRDQEQRDRALEQGSGPSGASRRAARAASISSSESRTRRAASPSGTNESLLDTRASAPR